MQELIGKIFAIILLVITIAVAWYGIFSFIEASFDITTWSQDMRGTAALFCCSTWGGLGMLLFARP